MDEYGNRTRPRRCLRALTIVVPLLVALGLIVASCDGYHNEPGSLSSFRVEPPLINWTHGWPFYIFVRSSIYPHSGKRSSPATFTGPAATYSRWPIDSAPRYAFRMPALLADIAIFVLLVAGSAYGAPRIARRWLLTDRSGDWLVWALLSLMTSASLFLLPALIADKHRYHFQAATFSLILLGMLLTLFTVIDLGRRVGSRARLMINPQAATLPIRVKIAPSSVSSN